MAARHLLIVDDEDNLRSMLRAALRHHGFEVTEAADGRAALDAVERDRPDLIVLDVMMPELDGFEVCRRLRAAGDDTPVLFLTARDAAEDRVSGFTKGGDDYVTKPFSLEELVARIRAILRRVASGPAAERSILAYEDLELDEDSMRVSRAGAAVQLSPTEFKLLRYLLVNRERVVSKTQILDQVWNYDFDGNASVVENYISYLRKKIDSGRQPLIHTVRGFGYVLRSDP